MTFAPKARLLATPLFQNAARPATVARCCPLLLRPFSQTTAKREDAPGPKKGGQALLSAMYGSRGASETPRSSPFGGLAPSARSGETDHSLLLDTLTQAGGDPSLLKISGDLDELVPEQEDRLEPFHMHVLSHKHNTHVTITKPNREAIISLSAGNIGFKKSKRRSYDAAYQLTAYIFEKLTYAGWHKKINRLELLLRGFGHGRDAAVKVLMAPEGKLWRNKIVRVADNTRLKFGGTRSKNPRRV